MGIRKLYHRIRGWKYAPKVGEVNWGDFEDFPFSREFGYDRGGPVDRKYIENFLEQEKAVIRGRALEIGDNSYSMQYGGSAITHSDILHVDDSNPAATIIGDIAHAPQIPDNSFDIIILTQTLHLIYDFRDALETCHRILRPGGALLLTVPGITPIDHGEWKYTWLWSFTQTSMQKLLGDHFPGGQIECETMGNVKVATAFLYGLGQTELSESDYKKQDEHFPVIITCKAVKA